MLESILAILTITNVLYGIYLAVTVEDRSGFKPYKGDFKIKHLLLIFFVPAILFSYVLLYLVIGSITFVDWLGESKFWNKPLFKKGDK